MPDPPASRWRPATRRARLTRRLLGVRRAVLTRRRPLAALLTAVAVLATVRTLAPPAPPSVEVLVAAHDLASGAVLARSDLRVSRLAPGAVPDGVAVDPVGRTLASPVRRGEPLTDVRLVGAALTAGHDGLVAVPVRLPDPGTVDLLAVGDRIDLVATDADGGSASVVAADVPVLALPGAVTAETASGLSGRLVVVGAPAADVPEIAAAAVRDYLSFTFAP